MKPRRERPPDEQIRALVNDLLKLVQLDEPSGGTRRNFQAASGSEWLGRRLWRSNRKASLLNQPSGALDAKKRQELRRWLRRLHDELHVTSLFVTHDQEEALEVADRVVVMNEGRIEQEGSPDEVYHRPANGFVYHFFGNLNLFHAHTKRRSGQHW